MFLLGRFERNDWLTGKIEGLTIKEKIDRNDLSKCKGDENYQVIDIKKRQYFNPIKNRWEKIDHEKM